LEWNSPSPGCWGAEVARAENWAATELEDIAGVKETDDVGELGSEEVIESCAVACRKRKFTNKLRRSIVLIVMALYEMASLVWNAQPAPGTQNVTVTVMKKSRNAMRVTCCRWRENVT
jgi:hypothetical protein